MFDARFGANMLAPAQILAVAARKQRALIVAMLVYVSMDHNLD